MKRILLWGCLVPALLLFTGCGSSVTSSGSEAVVLEDAYEGYYASQEDGIISVTNYDPDDLSALPDYQELIQYGDDAGLESEGVVYFIYVVDTSEATQENEGYYCAELEDGTMEVLVEEDTYFYDEALQEETVDHLLEIMTYVREAIYE